MKATINMLKNPIHLISLGLGVGLIPGMPGTYGSLLALLLFWPFAHYSLSTLLIADTLLFILGCYCCDYTAKVLKLHDPSPVVWDEIVAMFFILSFIPLSWLSYLLAFVAFRFFDILKPWPIHYCDQKLTGGFGIMFDDILAAIYSGMFLILYISYK